ncbi:DUF6397 family protein [Streptomyces sp. NPDC051561]|uniref:DUF6397 family protein n=1 Tax=Streptomyces sp. NPDC051561 TaxID=3365658 RepID=UPI0037B512A2
MAVRDIRRARVHGADARGADARWLDARGAGAYGASAYGASAHGTVTAVRAAQELGLKRGEFGLAVQLGRIRTVPDCGGGRRRVACEELDRLRESERSGTPLKVRLRTVDAGQGAELMGVGPFRFHALARAGYLSPFTFHLNHNRAVDWRYLAEELTDFTARHPGLLTGDYPQSLRAALDAGEDRRPRNWRSRRLGQLLGRTDDPWEQAAIFSSLLAPEDLAAAVRHPYETALLEGLRSGLVAAAPADPVARGVVRRLTVARDRDEAEWIRASLALSLAEARAQRPLPIPDGNAGLRTPEGNAGRSPRPTWARGVRLWLHRGTGRRARTAKAPGQPDRPGEGSTRGAGG